MPYSRQQEPWARQAVRGVSMVVALGLVVFLAYTGLAWLFVTFMGAAG